MFVKCTEAALTPLRERESGIFLAMYIDDWLVTAQSEQKAKDHTVVLILVSLSSGVGFPHNIIVLLFHRQDLQDCMSVLFLMAETCILKYVSFSNVFFL